MRRPVPNSSYPILTTEANRQEELSIAYVSAIAAHAGIRIKEVGRNDDGTDITFKRLRKRRSDNRYSGMSGMGVQCQIKSARHPEWNKTKYKGEDVISYALRAKNYNDIVTSTDGFLILMCLPSNIDAWVKQDEECLRLYHCCYYWFPGAEDTSETSNTKTKTIYIPLTQVFTPEELVRIVDEAQPEETR